jgi:Na+/phosphate symporter
MSGFRQSLNDQMKEQKMVDDMLREMEEEINEYAINIAMQKMTQQQMNELTQELALLNEEQKMVDEGLEELNISEAIDLTEEADERTSLPNSLYGFAQTLDKQGGLDEIDKFYK